VALYEYRCERDGPFEVALPMGTAPEAASCPSCAEDAARVYTNPMVRSQPRALTAALDHEEKTRYAPEVVTTLPRSGNRKPARMAPLTPALAKLPRPVH
jgi:putative FmdB family regulatory protein